MLYRIGEKYFQTNNGHALENNMQEMEYTLFHKTVYKIPYDILQKMWAVDSYAPLLTLSITEMFPLIQGIEYTHMHAFHAKNIYVCTKIGK